MLSFAKRAILTTACLALASGNLAVPGTANAQQASSNATSRLELSEQDRCAALQAIRTRLGRGYIYPDQVPTIAARLDCSSDQLRTGDPNEFARRVTQVMQEVSKDSHLYLNFQPQWYAAATTVPDKQAKASENAEDVRHARNFNFGLAEQRIMPGNVRYLKVVGFFWNGAESARAYEHAMRFLHDGRAIIIDLRGNRGGETEAMYFLLSHFLKPGAVITTIVTPGHPSQQVRAVRVPAAGMLSGKPLYILVSNQSRSAAEAVAHTVRQFKLGDVVGERTEGANHISEDAAIAPWFRLSVPVSYTLDPVSRSNWEGSGVEPTLPTSSRDALRSAYSQALARLLPVTSNGEERDFLLWAQDGVCGIDTPYSLSSAEMAQFSGSYGKAKIEHRDGALWLVRPDRHDIKLRPLCSGGLFEADDDDTFRVRISTSALDVLRPGAEPQHYGAN